MDIKQAAFITSMAEYGPFPGRGLPQIAVAGKSNVGKSSLINRLCGRLTYELCAVCRAVVYDDDFIIRKTRFHDTLNRIQ